MKPRNTDFDKRFKRQHRIVSALIGLAAVATVCGFIAAAVLTYQTVALVGEQDWSNGIKPVLERVWCGRPECFGK